MCALQYSASQQIGILIWMCLLFIRIREKICKTSRHQESMNFRLFASKNTRTTTSCKLPEFINEKELCAGPFRSDFMMLQHGFSLKNKNNFQSDWSNSKHGHFWILNFTKWRLTFDWQQSSNSCEEQCNEAHVSNELSTTEAVFWPELAKLHPGTTLSTQ